MNVILDFEDYVPSGIMAVGSAHSVSSEPDPADEAIRLLHEAVKQVTGKAVLPPARPRMGFLP